MSRIVIDQSDRFPERVPSGVPGLDLVLRGGFLKAGIFIIQGSPGAGKTILANQICFHHATQGGRALYVTLLAESHARMLLHLGQLGFFDPKLIPGQIYLVSAFSVLEENGIPGLLDLLRREVATHRASILVLDGLVSAEEAAGSSREYKKFIHSVQAQAALADCTTFLLANSQPVAVDHTMVDGVMQLETKLYGWRAERHLQVHKMRGTGYLRGEHSFQITDKGVVVFPRTEALLRLPSGKAEIGPPIVTGISVLDHMTGGGFPSACTALLTGPPGVGKTTLGLHFLSQSDEDSPGLHFGFYERPEAIASKANALGLPLKSLIERGHIEV
jgi:circadian clock protein KaiC